MRGQDQRRLRCIGRAPGVVESAVGLKGEVVARLQCEVGDGGGIVNGVAVRSTTEEGLVRVVGLADYPSKTWSGKNGGTENENEDVRV